MSHCYVIITFIHGLGRLTCSGIDALPSFLRPSTISSSSRFVVEGVFRKSGVVWISCLVFQRSLVLLLLRYTFISYMFFLESFISLLATFLLHAKTRCNYIPWFSNEIGLFRSLETWCWFPRIQLWFRNKFW